MEELLFSTVIVTQLPKDLSTWCQNWGLMHDWVTPESQHLQMSPTAQIFHGKRSQARDWICFSQWFCLVVVLVTASCTAAVSRHHQYHHHVSSTTTSLTSYYRIENVTALTQDNITFQELCQKFLTAVTEGRRNFLLYHQTQTVSFPFLSNRCNLGRGEGRGIPADPWKMSCKGELAYSNLYIMPRSIWSGAQEGFYSIPSFVSNLLADLRQVT